MVSHFDDRSDDRAVSRLTEQYNIESRAYTDHWAPIVHPVACTLLDELPQHSVKRALDLGAGAGLLLPVIQKKYREAFVVGVDRSEGLVNLANSDSALDAGGFDLAVGDAASLCIRSHSFDLIVMAFMLYHLPDPKIALMEAKRVLKPGGVLGLTTWAGDMESPVVGIWNEELEASGAVPAESLGRVAQHELMDSPEKVRGLLESTGLVSVRARVQEFTHRIELEEFIRLRTRVGSTRQRFESLNENARRRFDARVRERLSELSAGDWVLRMPIVLATARSAR